MTKKEKILDFYNKWIPKYARLPLWMMLIINVGGYELFKLFTFGRQPYDLTLPLDDLIPVVPATVLIYFASFAFWFFGYIAACRLGEEQLRRFFTADLGAKLCTFIIFVAAPTFRVRPEVVGTGFFPWLLRLLYAIDTPLGLFPSLHCLNSWMCFLGVRGQREVPLWYKIFSCVFAVAIFAATLTTAQHVFVDVIAGALIAEVFWFISGRAKGLCAAIGRFLDASNRVKDRFFARILKKNDRKETPESTGGEG